MTSRDCRVCSRPIPEGRQANTVFCSTVCEVENRRLYRKRAYAANAEAIRADAKLRMASKRATPEGREKNRLATENCRRRNGTLELWEKNKKDAKRRHLELAYEKLIERNAIDAFKYWLNVKASDETVAIWFAVIGFPWRNPRLSDAQRWKMRYDMDEVFRQQEIHRSGHKRAIMASRNDGTVDYGKLIAERKTCPYCGVPIGRDNRVIDHMEPVSKGGENSANNVVACCRECNTEKAGKTFAEWLAVIPEEYRKGAERIYVKKRGTRPGNLVLALSF
jgi:predicted nucleic acid-binding Zn ribbon protein